MSSPLQDNCPICLEDTYSYFSHKDLFNHEVELMKCKNCGHGSYRNIWTQSQFDQIYGAEYAKDYLNLTETHTQRQEQYVLDLLLLKEFFPKRLKVLDFGCSSGEYLDSMPDLWDKFGYEVNPALVSILNATRPGYRIYNNISDIDEYFDLITLRGVIEHIPDHSILIEFIGKQLKIGGTLYISATPDFSSPCAVKYKSSWNQILSPEHIHQFTPASLQILLSTSGLVMKGLYHPYMGTPYENWESDSKLYLANRGIGLPNSLNSKEVNLPNHPFPGNMMSVIFEKIR